MSTSSQIPSSLSAVFMNPNGTVVSVKGVSQELVTSIRDGMKSFGRTQSISINLLREAAATSFSSLRGVYGIGAAPEKFKDCVKWLETAIENGQDYCTIGEDYSNKILSYMLEKVKESNGKIPPKQVINDTLKQLEVLAGNSEKNIPVLKNTTSVMSARAGKEAKAQLIRNATGALAAIKILAKLPVRTAISVMGKGGVTGICTAEFIVVYAGTRLVIENTQTGKRIDTAMTNSMEKIFWKHFYKAQDVLVKKSPLKPEEKAKIENRIEKLLEEIDAPATKSLIYANPPRKTSRKK